MEEVVTWSTTIPFITTAFIFILVLKSSDLYKWILRWLGTEERNPDQQEDIMKVALQIAEEWEEAKKLIQAIQESQNCFVGHLQSNIQAAIEIVGRNFTISLEKEILRNDQKFAKIKCYIEDMKDDILSMKNVLLLFVKKPPLMTNENKGEEEISEEVICIDSSVNEIKKGIKDLQIGADSETSKLVTTVKKCLEDIIKDTKLHLSIDEEETNRELQIILKKLSEDREDIKKTIIQAFSIAAEQAKRNFDQFGEIGQNTMHYIAVLNENTNKILNTKLGETDNRLKKILNSVKQQTFDHDAIKEILQNIDGQFDDIFQKMELGCQRNTEHCEKLAQSLENTSSNWMTTASKLEDTTRSFSNDVKHIKEMLKEIKISTDTSKETGIKLVDKERCEIVQYESITRDTNQNLTLISQKQRHMTFIYSVMQSCSENLVYMNSRIENGCESICKQIEGLEHKLSLLKTSVGRAEEVIRNISLENLNDHSGFKFHDHEEIIEGIESTNICDVGDDQTQIYNDSEKNIVDQKMRIVIAKKKAEKLIERMLNKVCENRNSNFQKIESHHKSKANDITDVTEEFQVALRKENEHAFESLSKPEREGKTCNR